MQAGLDVRQLEHPLDHVCNSVNVTSGACGWGSAGRDLHPSSPTNPNPEIFLFIQSIIFDPTDCLCRWISARRVANVCP